MTPTDALAKLHGAELFVGGVGPEADSKHRNIRACWFRQDHTDWENLILYWQACSYAWGMRSTMSTSFVPLPDKGLPLAWSHHLSSASLIQSFAVSYMMPLHCRWRERMRWERRWILWSWKESGVLPYSLPPPTHSGRIITSISSIHQVMQLLYMTFGEFIHAAHRMIGHRSIEYFRRPVDCLVCIELKLPLRC